MRGRLIFPMVARIARLDTTATRAASQYDDDFRSVKRLEVDGLQVSGRSEHAVVDIPCQVEDTAWRAQRMAPGGDQPDTRLVLVMHFRDLERLELVDTVTGDALLRPNDRLVELVELRSGAVSQRAKDLFITEAKPGGFGFGGKRNLLIVTFDDRQRGVA